MPLPDGSKHSIFLVFPAQAGIHTPQKRQPDPVLAPREADLPDSLVEFGRVDGVWVAGLRAWPALAVALREQLIEVAFAHAAAEGKSEKMELLYHYLAGDQFRRRIEATVEAFTALQRGLDGERRAMERIWKER